MNPATPAGEDGRAVAWISLVASSGTLICCALPILLVTLGMGSAVAALSGSLPVLITLSENKEWVFAGSALLLALGGWLLYRPGAACPSDPRLAALCLRARRTSQRIFKVSAAVWLVGFVAAYALLPLRIWLGI